MAGFVIAFAIDQGGEGCLTDFFRRMAAKIEKRLRISFDKPLLAARRKGKENDLVFGMNAVSQRVFNL